MNTTFLQALFSWIFKWPQLLTGALYALALVSALGVIYSVHLTRLQYAELQELQATQDYLDSEYEKLLLEQGAWADYSRVDKISRNELAMKAPERSDLVVVRR